MQQEKVLFEYCSPSERSHKLLHDNLSVQTWQTRQWQTLIFVLKRFQRTDKQ